MLCVAHSLEVAVWLSKRATPNDNPRKGQLIYESPKIDDVGRCTLFTIAMRFAGYAKGVGPGCSCAFNVEGLQPIPARYSPAGFEFRDTEGPARGRFHRIQSDSKMALLTAANTIPCAPRTEPTRA
jgi:hypothetical protein